MEKNVDHEPSGTRCCRKDGDSHDVATSINTVNKDNIDAFQSSAPSLSPSPCCQQKDEKCASPLQQNETSSPIATNTGTTKPKRRIIRRRGGGASRPNPNAVPDVIAKNEALQNAITHSLPREYNFEIPKTIYKIQQLNAKHVALQMPEGLLMYGCILCDLLKQFSNVGQQQKETTSDEKKDKEETHQKQTSLRITILGDVTYGACCVDDLGAQALGCDLLVHYGHSCLVPIQHTQVPCLYIFVELLIDVQHLVDCICATFPRHASNNASEQLEALPVQTTPILLEEDTDTSSIGVSHCSTTIINENSSRTIGEDKSNQTLQFELMGVVQFRAAVAQAASILHRERGYKVNIPQAKPLSPGEVLGCTAPTIVTSSEQDQSPIEHVMIFIADGRFHLEAAMIANPTLRAYRYDPYNKKLTQEWYDTPKMKSLRNSAISQARISKVKTFGIILGTLGRQGNPAIVGRIMSLLRKHSKKYMVVLLSEIFPLKLQQLQGDGTIDAWVQVACPRLSVDWGHHFTKPLLNPYELEQVFASSTTQDSTTTSVKQGTSDSDELFYPMDYYKLDSGPWTNYHGTHKQRTLCAHQDK